MIAQTFCFILVPNARGLTGQNFMFTCIVMVFALFVFFYHTPMARNNNFEPSKSYRKGNVSHYVLLFSSLLVTFCILL